MQSIFRRRWVVLAILALLLAGAAALAVAASDDQPEGQTDAARVEALLRDVPQTNYSLGKVGAPYVLVYYTDPYCPRCSAFYADVLPTLIHDYVRPGRVRILARPVTTPGGPRIALREAFAATLQDKLWNFLLLFDAKSDDTLNPRVTARQIPGLNVATLEADAQTDRVEEAIKRAADRRRTLRAGVPSLYLDPPGDDPFRVRQIDFGASPDGILATIEEAVGARGSGSP